MGCGCKNNQNTSNQTSQTQQVAQNTQTKKPNETVQENIKKVIEKYYTIKKS
jgi:hypothetical protein